MTKKKWAGYEVERQEKIDSAFRVAQDAQKKTPVEKEESRRKVGSLAKAGTKKRPYGKRVLPPFEGVSQQQSDVIREFVAYEFSGYSKRAAADKVGNYSTIMGTQNPLVHPSNQTARRLWKPTSTTVAPRAKTPSMNNGASPAKVFPIKLKGSKPKK